LADHGDDPLRVGGAQAWFKPTLRRSAVGLSCDLALVRAVPVALVTDTTHYLPRQLVAAKGLHEVSLYVKFEGRQVRESELLDDFDGFYDKLRTASEMPTTSQPSIGDSLAACEPLLNEGKDIDSVH